jgi:hypothetical protein
MKVKKWKNWFVDIMLLIFSKLDEKECAVFFQTDIKVIKVLCVCVSCVRVSCVRVSCVYV